MKRFFNSYVPDIAEQFERIVPLFQEAVLVVSRRSGRVRGRERDAGREHRGPGRAAHRRDRLREVAAEPRGDGPQSARTRVHAPPALLPGLRAPVVRNTHRRHDEVLTVLYIFS